VAYTVSKKKIDSLPTPLDALRVGWVERQLGSSPEALLFKKRRQLQDGVPDSPDQRDPNDKPVDDKARRAASGFILLSHKIIARLGMRILPVKLKAFGNRAHEKVADQSGDQ
jgi:hypothetical protein